MNALYKKATGRSFHTSDDQSPGHQLYWSIGRAVDAEKRIEEASQGKLEKKKRATNYFKAARDMDEKRVSDYYTDSSEMLARAFEAYVYDKLNDSGQRSDYLVGKAENKYYAMFGMKPFPEGEERKAINAAFDELFKTVKTKKRQDDKGEHVEMYSRTASSTE